ncbi:mandelate racemase/muconate lactonizing enzyme family protein [Candidatus Roseilinea sp. NK_OTU-006]|jgi:L-alanine-DL-glutamate epimerase-like enolase superfamily enzyme|uniref:mandelate racemase/muconate lactonizing enzyme family protein n=1 Tax=Candidatus Roseilinea sp. NK_OTU-006 TaxID=2704250 RepID=UPI00145C9EF0|nr:mandelate racemase/muconate lactonizing enzyme family protein [Candidatus Roseilinea sp. NK_OTU-006]
MHLVESLEAFRVVVPLPEPLFVWGRVITEREFVFARAQAGGQTGIGYGLGRVAGIVEIIERHLKPLVVGRPAHAIRPTWEAARRAMRMIGEGGAFARALSIVDLALWDLHTKLIGVPIWKLLGGEQREVPCIAIAGYYQPDNPVGKVRRDAEALAAAGYTGFKLPIGEDRDLDVQRVRAMREVVGKDALIGVDASGTFDSVKQALDVWRALKPFDIAFLEDPFPADRWSLAIALAQRGGMPVAFGESLSAPDAVQALGSPAGVDIVRPDVTHQMGLTGYLQAITPALESHKTIFPHYFPDLHAPLVAALGGAWVEESPAEADTVGFRLLRAEQPLIRSGMWCVNERPGFGIVWDEDALQRFRRP